MKTFIFHLLIFTFAANSFAQTVNWRSLQQENKHIVNINTGWDYAATFGVAYGHKLNFRIPLVIGTEFSLPSGETLLDDFKTKIGVQAEVYRYNSFSATVKVLSLFRRYKSEFTRLANFGSEFSTAFGYYRPRWYAAAEFGFDKAIVTHIRHSALMEDYNPEIQSGWYIPTGGNFFYGVQLGYSFKGYDVYLKTGKTITQDFKTSAAIPLYLQLGLNAKF